jgi:hypothetical protein
VALTETVFVKPFFLYSDCGGVVFVCLHVSYLKLVNRL